VTKIDQDVAGKLKLIPKRVKFSKTTRAQSLWILH